MTAPLHAYDAPAVARLGDEALGALVRLLGWAALHGDAIPPECAARFGVRKRTWGRLVDAGTVVAEGRGFRLLPAARELFQCSDVDASTVRVSTQRTSSGPRSSADRTRAWRERQRLMRDGDARRAVTDATGESVACLVTRDAGCAVSGDGETSPSLSLLSSEDRKSPEEIERDRDLTGTESLHFSSPISSGSDLPGHDRARGDARTPREVTACDASVENAAASPSKRRRRQPRPDLDPKVDIRAATSPLVAQVFEHWVSELGRVQRLRVRPKLDMKRATIISRQLRYYRPEQLRAAISGACATPFNRGENAHGKVYLDLGLILRDADHIERFAAAAPPTAPSLAPVASGVPIAPEEARRLARAASRSIGDIANFEVPSGATLPPPDLANVEALSSSLFALANGDR